MSELPVVRRAPREAAVAGRAWVWSASLRLRMAPRGEGDIVRQRPRTLPPWSHQKGVCAGGEAFRPGEYCGAELQAFRPQQPIHREEGFGTAQK